MNKIRKHRRPMAEINVVPYIDVMLVLLVIFMITAPLITEGVRVDIPQGNATAVFQDAKNPLIITVTSTGELFLNRGENQNMPITDGILLTTITEALKADSSLVVMVKGDKQVNYGRVVHAMALAQDAGASSVGLITESSAIR